MWSLCRRFLRWLKLFSSLDRQAMIRLPCMFASQRLLQRILTEVLGLRSDVNKLLTRENSMAIDVSALLAEVAKETTVEQSAVTLINKIAANQADLSKQLAAAIAADDPAAMAAVQKAIDDSVAQLQANDTELAASVTANTPAAPSA